VGIRKNATAEASKKNYPPSPQAQKRDSSTSAGEDKLKGGRGEATYREKNLKSPHGAVLAKVCRRQERRTVRTIFLAGKRLWRQDSWLGKKSEDMYGRGEVVRLDRTHRI